MQAQKGPSNHGDENDAGKTRTHKGGQHPRNKSGVRNPTLVRKAPKTETPERTGIQKSTGPQIKNVFDAINPKSPEQEGKKERVELKLRGNGKERDAARLAQGGIRRQTACDWSAGAVSFQKEVAGIT